MTGVNSSTFPRLPCDLHSLGVLKKTAAFDLVIPFLGINPTEIHTDMHQETCKRKFIAALFALVPSRNDVSANRSMAK